MFRVPFVSDFNYQEENGPSVMEVAMLISVTVCLIILIITVAFVYLRSVTTLPMLYHFVKIVVVYNI